MTEFVDDFTVRDIIKEKIRLATGPSLRAKLGNAFDLISDDRERLHPGDVNYAAAEHYFFSRWLIAWTGPVGWPFLAASAGGYDVFKRLLPPEALPRFGDGPVTPRAVGDLQWSRRGAGDGLDDSYGAFWKKDLSGPTFP